MIPDRKFKCIVPHLNFILEEEILLIDSLESTITNTSTGVVISKDFIKSQIRSILQIIKDPKLFKEIDECIFSTSDLINFTLWYKEDVIFPSSEQIREAIEHWIEYQKPKIEFLETISN